MSKRALVVSGGFGTRLRPYTNVIPKPLLPIGQETLLERQIGILLAAGFEDISVALHYLPDLFTAVLGTFAKRMGISLHLIMEEAPMGTFGSVFRLCDEALGEGDSRPVVVVNADIVSDIDLNAFYRFSKEGGLDMAVSVNDYQCEVPYGVITCDGGRVKQVHEKPSLTFPILAGVYFVRPQIAKTCAHFKGRPVGVDDVMKCLMESGSPIGVYPHEGGWIDAGTIEDLERAQVLLTR